MTFHETKNLGSIFWQNSEKGISCDTTRLLVLLDLLSVGASLDVDTSPEISFRPNPTIPRTNRKWNLVSKGASAGYWLRCATVSSSTLTSSTVRSVTFSMATMPKWSVVWAKAATSFSLSWINRHCIPCVLTVNTNGVPSTWIIISSFTATATAFPNRWMCGIRAKVSRSLFKGMSSPPIRN